MSNRPPTPMPCEICPLNRSCDFVVCFLREDPTPPPPPWSLPR